MSSLPRDVGMKRDIHVLDERRRVQEKESLETESEYNVNRESKSD